MQAVEPLTSEAYEAISELVRAQDRAALLADLDARHEADIAEIITVLAPDLRTSLLQLVGDALEPEVFAELDDAVRDDVLEVVDTDTVVNTVQQLDSDDAVFVLEDMDDDERQEVLEQIPQTDRLVLERALDFPEDSAGRLMQSAFISVPPYWSVGQTIDYLRDTEDLPDDFLEIYIIDPTYKPIGVVHLAEMLRAQRVRPMEELQHDDFYIIQAETDREEVALLFERYNLVTAPVVDDDQRLIGVITADDVFEVIAEEAGEDILRLGGVGDEAVTDTVLDTARGRASWLFLNLLTAIAASLVIGLFDASIEKMVALAVLMPIVASMGGNAGTQTLTITVRALATQELLPVNAARLVYREFRVGLLNGMVFAIITGIIGGVWFGDNLLGVVLAAAMIVNLVVAALAGILIPIGLNRINIDPALASSVFVTTVTDVIGFFAFLGFATIFLL
ncbi:MAG: magnesium transporter [Rhodobiaceae bacterium]|nr:magnesium transporter [Rhodobiaceae bacterium]RPF94244.1 MAG: magnesium transporter [Rhizobiales bacterium TMED162]